MRRVILATLICGIMPGLMGLSSYITPTQPVYAEGYDITQISTMQEMQPYICDNTTIGQSNTLTDTRDNSTYTVAKLSDGKCWMTQNLRITREGVEANSVSPILDSGKTDIIDGRTFTLPYSNIAGFTDNATANIYYAGDEVYGAYYSWCAATAGYCSNISEANQNTTISVCPKGWRLPTQLEYGILKQDLGQWSEQVVGGKTYEGRILGGALWIAAGTATSDTELQYTTNGYYWSGTSSSEEKAYDLFFLRTGTNSAASNSRLAGRSVRCLAQGWPSQDVNVVAVRVAPVISIDAVSGMTTEVEPHKVTEGTISATVSANTTYDVLLSTNNTSLTNPENLEGPSIPATSPTNPVQPNTNAWGIKTSTNTYLPITTTPTSFYNTEQYDEIKQSTEHTFTIGVSVAPSLPSGEYSTTVTITAVNN